MNELNDIALVVPVVFFPFPSFLPSLLRGGLYVAGRGACDVSADVLIFFSLFNRDGYFLCVRFGLLPVPFRWNVSSEVSSAVIAMPLPPCLY